VVRGGISKSSQLYIFL